VIETPLGPVSVLVDGDVVVEIAFDKKKPSSSSGPLVGEAERQLTAYFAKKLTAFDLPVGAPGTEFQKRVWKRLCAIKPGTTTTYGALAKELASGPRAVGTANGSNPIAIVVPCHRVIGSNGDLTGYGGGLHRKRWLLQHEGAVLL